MDMVPAATVVQLEREDNGIVEAREVTDACFALPVGESVVAIGKPILEAWPVAARDGRGAEEKNGVAGCVMQLDWVATH